MKLTAYCVGIFGLFAGVGCLGFVFKQCCLVQTSALWMSDSQSNYLAFTCETGYSTKLTSLNELNHEFALCAEGTSIVGCLTACKAFTQTFKDEGFRSCQKPTCNLEWKIRSENPWSCFLDKTSGIRTVFCAFGSQNYLWCSSCGSY